MRARNIKPSTFKNDELSELDPLARLLFIGLWCYADREGRCEHRPKRIKAEILPYDDCDIDSLIEQLSARDFIRLYQVDGDDYLWIPKFNDHQRPHQNEKDSDIPAWESGCSTKVQSTSHQGNKSLQPNTQALRSDPLLIDSGSLIPERGSLNDESTIAPKTARAREPDLMFESVAECWLGSPYPDLTLTKSQRGSINACAAQLKAIDADPSDVPKEWASLRARFDNPTPAALAKHWGTNGTGPKQATDPVDELKNPIMRALMRDAHGQDNDDDPGGIIDTQARGIDSRAAYPARIGQGSRPDG